MPTGDPEAETEEFLECYPQLRTKKFVLFMGRIHPKKGCDLLIEAFSRVLAKFPSWHLVMAGPDQLGWGANLKNRASQLGLDSRIIWTGMISGSSKWGALRAAEVFALPSHQENFGIAVAEALAVGLPTLISNKVNIWREICSDGAGIVEHDTVEGACRLLQAYLEMPEAKRQGMRESARSCFERRYEISAATKNLEFVLSHVAGLD